MNYFLLPAYNEEKSLPKLIKDIQSLFPPPENMIVIVDDGSSDRTAEISVQYSVDLVRHGRNLGLGEALNSGLNYIIARAASDDVIVTMDADNTHDPQTVKNLIAKINDGYDIAIASRYSLGGQQIGVGLSRRILSRGINRLLKMFYPIREVKDYSSGFRAYRAAIIKRGLEKYHRQLIKERGFSCMSEILIKLAGLGAKAGEVPLVLHYDRKEGRSKIRLANVIFRYIRMLFLLRREIS